MNPIILPMLIQAQELASFLRKNRPDKNLRIVDLSSESNYRQGHIPNAIFLPYQSLVSGQPPAPGKLPRIEQLQEIFQYLGLDENTHFIVCDDEGGGWAGRFIWTLDVIGHKHYSYIDGGMLAWKAKALPMVSDVIENPYKLESPPDIVIRHSELVTVDSILEQLNKNKQIIWDARSPEEYLGRRGNSSKLGHIPGAKNIEWTELMDANQHYKIRADAKDFLAEHGLNSSTSIVTHCQTHHRSGFTYLVGKLLGFDIKAYDGSWSEWGNHPNTPVEI